jgi:NADH:ubiquinone oxidoreductase subunit H
MSFGWKFLLPLAIANLVATAIAVAWWSVSGCRLPGQ